MNRKSNLTLACIHSRRGAANRYFVVATMLVMTLLLALLLRTQNRPACGPQQPVAGSGQTSDNAPLAMALIPAGEFQMGISSGIGAPIASPRHKIYLSAFYMDKYEVTVSQYAKFAQATGRKLAPQLPQSNPRHPVVFVNWYDADAYCKWAGKHLPTEAQWEKAAKGASDTDWHFGADVARLGEYAWYVENSGGQTHPVGEKKPNQYGLYDMAGNAGEWCADFFSETYYRNSPVKNPTGPASGSEHVLRGGSWGGPDVITRHRIRKWLPPNHDNSYLGFRCAR